CRATGPRAGAGAGRTSPTRPTRLSGLADTNLTALSFASHPPGPRRQREFGWAPAPQRRPPVRSFGALGPQAGGVEERMGGALKPYPGPYPDKFLVRQSFDLQIFSD